MRTNLKAYVTFMGGSLLNVTAINASTAWWATIFHTRSRLDAGQGRREPVPDVSGRDDQFRSALDLRWLRLTKRGRREAPVFHDLTQSCFPDGVRAV